MSSIPLLCSLREHQQKVCIMLSRFWHTMAVQGMEVERRKFTTKAFFRKILNKVLKRTDIC